MMLWSEIRKAYPNQYVLLKALQSHFEGDKKFIDEVALLKVISDSMEASKMLVRCKGDTFVFHTAKEELSMQVVNGLIGLNLLMKANAIIDLEKLEIYV